MQKYKPPQSWGIEVEEIMIRTIKEYFNPALKCDRIGHELRTQTAVIRRHSNMLRAVVADYSCNLQVCHRCDKIVGQPENEEFLEGFTSCIMPNEMWDKINKNGYLVRAKTI